MPLKIPFSRLLIIAYTPCFSLCTVRTIGPKGCKGELGNDGQKGQKGMQGDPGLSGQMGETGVPGTFLCRSTNKLSKIAKLDYT